MGCGWLGWKPTEVRECHIADLNLAIKGKIKMLESCYGGGDKKEKKEGNFKRADTVEAFDEIFGVR